MENREQGACPARRSHPSSLTFTSQPCRLSWAALAWRALQGTCVEGMRGGQQPERLTAAHCLPAPVLHAALVFPSVTYSHLWARLGCARPLPLAVYSPAQEARGWASATGFPTYCPECLGCGSNQSCWGLSSVLRFPGDIWEPIPCPAIHRSCSRASVLFLTCDKNIRLWGFAFTGHTSWTGSGWAHCAKKHPAACPAHRASSGSWGGRFPGTDVEFRDCFSVARIRQGPHFVMVSQIPSCFLSLRSWKDDWAHRVWALHTSSGVRVFCLSLKWIVSFAEFLSCRLIVNGVLNFVFCCSPLLLSRCLV